MASSGARAAVLDAADGDGGGARAATAWALHRTYQALLERGTRRDRRARRLFLQRMPLFSELGRQHVQTVAQYVHEVELYADEAVPTSTLQTTGDGSDLNSVAGLDGHGGDAVFIVYSGLVEARRTDRRQSSRGASESKAAPGAPITTLRRATSSASARPTIALAVER